MKSIIISLLLILSTSCNSQKKKTDTSELDNPEKVATASQIAQYVTNVFEDSKSHLWFGTLEKGIAKYDGNQLKYYTQKDGLPSNRVTGIIEDANGIYWLNTGSGLSKYDGKTFTNFTVKDDFSSNMISNLLIDSKGTFWVGTWGGVFTFDGKEFKHFPLPYPEVETKINVDTKNWITGIREDADGNIWIARDGYGACKYDGKSFVHFLKKDGLHSNNVTEIEFDEEGNVWFGTRVAERDNPDPEERTGKGGVNKLVDNEMLSFPEIEAFNNSDVYTIFKDNSGDIWISTISKGVYRYDGTQFKNYNIPIAIMDVIIDRKGNVLLGGAGGLYRISPNGTIVNVTQDGPWE